MALLPILTAPDPRLKKVARPVEDVNRSIRQQITDLLESMYDAQGIGLAATQCGLDARLVVVDFPETPEGPGRLLKMVNPEIIWISPEWKKDQEGCLSVPGFAEEVDRPQAVAVRYWDENNRPQELAAEGYFAKCLQHELDHLNGVLYVDHLSSLKRSRILKKLILNKKAQDS